MTEGRTAPEGGDHHWRRARPRSRVLVNNAGRGMRYVSDRLLSEPSRFWETDPDVWRMVIDTNVNGPFYMARAAVLGMIARGSGSLINISMNDGMMKRRGFLAVRAIEGGARAGVDHLGPGSGGHRVRVNVLLPGARPTRA